MASLDDGGGGAGGLGVKEYLHPDADKLLDKVDWFEMLGDLFRAWWRLILSVGAGLVVGTSEALGLIADSAGQAGSEIWDSFTGVISTAGSASAQQLQSELSTFDLFSGPAGILFGLMGIAIISWAVAVFFLGD